MNINSPVEIHEFSTGIKFDRLADGGWVSRGFTGEYMNCTIDPVPLAVERSISNREFRIAEGTASQDPAIVARVVGAGEDIWSVIAIVSEGKDEVGRSGSFYRYFLTQGKVDKISHILAWLEKDRENRKSSQLRVFNPLDEVNQPHIENIVTHQKLQVSLEDNDYLKIDNIPVIFPKQEARNYNQIPILLYLHALTLKKVEIEEEKGNYLPIAWAFNVEAVEQINRFTIIRAASEHAFDILNRAKGNAAKALALPYASFDEQAVKSAIKGLSNSVSTALKTEYINALAEAIGNKAIDPNHWHRIFDGQGANNALKQKIYTPQMIKLLILRALAIPSTLPEYYSWRAEAGKGNNVEAIAQEFEYEFSNKLLELKKRYPHFFTFISQNIVKGFGVFTSKFLNDDGAVSPKAMVIFLKDSQGLWGSKSKEFINNLKNDLQKMPTFATNLRTQNREISENNNLQFDLNDDSWKKIREEIVPYWQDRNYYIEPNPKYLKFAELFEEIGENTLAMVFYRIGQGILTPSQFKKLTNNHKGYSISTKYGIKIRRKQNQLEKFIYIIDHLIQYLSEDPSENTRQREHPMKRFMSMAITLGIAGISFVSGVAIGNTKLGNLPFIRTDNNSDPNSSSGSSPNNAQRSSPNDRTSSSDTVDRTSNDVDRKIDYKVKLAKNIIVLNGLKKQLEEEIKKNGADKYPSLKSDLNIEIEIISQFKFNPDQEQKIISLLKDSSYSPDITTMEKDITKIHLDSWKPEDVKQAVKVFKSKISNKNDDVMLSDGSTIKKVREALLKKWKQTSN